MSKSRELSGCAKCIRLMFVICNIPILVSEANFYKCLAMFGTAPLKIIVVYCTYIAFRVGVSCHRDMASCSGESNRGSVVRS